MSLKVLSQYRIRVSSETVITRTFLGEKDGYLIFGGATPEGSYFTDRVRKNALTKVEVAA